MAGNLVHFWNLLLPVGQYGLQRNQLLNPGIVGVPARDMQPCLPHSSVKPNATGHDNHLACVWHNMRHWGCISACSTRHASECVFNNVFHAVKMQHAHVRVSVTNDTGLQSCTTVAPRCADTQGKSNLTVQRDVLYPPLDTVCYNPTNVHTRGGVKQPEVV